MTTREERLLGGYSGRMLVTLSVAWATLQLGRFLLPPLLPAIITDLEMTTLTAGIALGALQAVYALTQFPSGRLSDRFTRPSLIVPGLIALTGAFLLLSVATAVWLFFAAAISIGVGKGLFAVPSRAQLSDLFVEKRGQALGLYAAGTDLGGILAAGGGVVVTGSGALLALFDGSIAPLSLGWRDPFTPLVVLLALVAIAYVGWNHDPYRLGRADVELVTTVQRIMTTRAQRDAMVAFALFYFVVGAWVNFLPTYLTQAKGFSEPVAAGLFAVVFVVGIVVKPVAGLASDRVPRRAVAASGLLFSVGALVGVVLAASVTVVATAIAVYAIGYKTVFPVADALLLDAAPDGNVGGDLGAARAVFIGVGALGPIYMGGLADIASFQIAFIGLGACLLVAAALLLRGLRGE